MVSGKIPGGDLSAGCYHQTKELGRGGKGRGGAGIPGEELA